MRKAKTFRPLYGKDVCKKCYYGFANRRQLAYVFDAFLIQGGYYLGIFVVALLGFEEDSLGFSIAFLALIALTYAMLLLKDGFAGHSFGKALTGVQVLDENSGLPGSWLHSLKRNLPTLVPVVPLIIAYQLQKGKRWGDGIARSKVIWKKYRDHPVFTGESLGFQEEIGSDYQRPEGLPEIDESNPFSPPAR
jgi:uncharacterized RDD family membrane protein YckC